MEVVYITSKCSQIQQHLKPFQYLIYVFAFGLALFILYKLF